MLGKDVLFSLSVSVRNIMLVVNVVQPTCFKHYFNFILPVIISIVHALKQ